MKRSRAGVAITAAALALLGAGDLPAAADSRTVIRSVDDFGIIEHVAGLTYVSCDPLTSGEVVSGLPAPVVDHAASPVPLGTRTWGFSTEIPGAVGPYRTIASMADLTAVQMSVETEDASASGVAFAEVVADETHAWYGNAPLSVTPGGWEVVEGAGDTSYTWRQVDTSSGQTQGTPFTGTIDAMLAEIGGDRPGMVGLGFGCTTGHLVHFDDVRFGTTGDVATYDFEGGTTTTSLHADRTTVTAGRSPGLSAAATLHAEQLLPPRMRLERRAFDSRRWHRVTTVSAAWDGGGFITDRVEVKPLHTTSYRWRYLTDQANDGSVSPVTRVRVRTALLFRSPGKVQVGSPIVVNGRTLPGKPGQRVTLWHGDHLLAADRVDRHGRFGLRAPTRFRGNLHLTARIPRSPGNLRGSKDFVVRVR